MKRVIFLLDGQRVDKPDANALHDLVVSEFRRHTVDLVAGAGFLVVSGFTVALTGPSEPKQVTITRGVAIAGEVKIDGSMEPGQVLSEGPAQQAVSFIGRDSGTWSIWVGFQYVEGESRNRAYLVDVDGEQTERVEMTSTRLVPTWQVTATLDGVDDDPEGAWVRVKRVTYSGADLANGNLAEARDMLFEGQGGSDWALPDFDRNNTRTAVALPNLKAWAWAVMKRLEEVNGRRWHNKPVFGENLRSASAQVTVRHTGGDATTAHYTLGDNGASNRATLTLMLLAPSRVAGDPRLDLHFLPDDTDELAVIPVDTSAQGVSAIGAVMRRHVRGAAELRRTAGDNDLISTSGGSGYVGTFEGLTFSATSGAGVLFRSNKAGDRLTFRDCIFDGSGAGSLVALVAVDANARITFERCKFVALSTTKGVTFGVDSEAVASFIGCDFIGGSRQIEMLDSPSPQVTCAGCTFIDGTRAIYGADEGGLVLHNCYFENTIPVDTPDIDYPAGGEVFANGGELAGGIVSGRVLETRGRYVYFGKDRLSILSHDGTLISGVREVGGVADLGGRYLYAVGNRIVFTSTSPDALRFQRRADDSPVVALLDQAGDEPVSSMLRMHRLLLGPTTVNGLDQVNRNLVPKAWGCIRQRADADWDGTGDRAGSRAGHLADGYFESRTVRGNGTPLTVRGYYLPENGGTDDALLEWTEANGATSQSRPSQTIFRVSGLTLPDARYHVEARVDSGDGLAFGNGGALTSRSASVQVFRRTSNEFWLLVVADSNGATNTQSWLSAATEIRVTFAVFGIVDAGTFVNGGAG